MSAGKPRPLDESAVVHPRTPSPTQPTAPPTAHSKAAVTTAQMATPENLRYLREHRVCELLEFLVRRLMTERPEDPTLAMCNFIRDANRQGAAFPRALPPTAKGTAPPAAERSAQAAAWKTDAVSPTSSTSRHFPADGSTRGILAASRNSSAAAHRGLERDDSARSDVSVFSIASVDMNEFLADFRAAHFSVCGAGSTGITLEQLGSIVDRVALPLPDTRLLPELFTDMDPDATGAVPFDAFLARMCHRIQGKFHPEVVRGLFVTLALQFPPTRPRTPGVPVPMLSPLDTLNEANFASSAASRASSAGGGPRGATHALDPLVCLEHGFRRGLGLRLGIKEFDDLLHRIGLPRADEAPPLHFVDFSRLLQFATAHHSGASEGQAYSESCAAETPGFADSGLP